MAAFRSLVCCAAGGDSHAMFAIGVPSGPDKVVAEPAPLRLDQVLDQLQGRSATVDHDPAQLLVGEPVGLLQHAVPRERQERQSCVELTCLDPRHRLSLRFQHLITIIPATVPVRSRGDSQNLFDAVSADLDQQGIG
jgi:hypothetical protein